MHGWVGYRQRNDGALPPDEPPGADLSPSVRDRQVAVQYLRAASGSSNGRERALLRRRAAELILPRSCDSRPTRSARVAPPATREPRRETGVSLGASEPA